MPAIVRLSMYAIIMGATFACSKAEQHRPTREPVIKVEFQGSSYDFILNENAPCGMLEDGTPYVEAKWYREPLGENEPPFLIKGAGGWTGNTYEEPHTWIYGVFETERKTQNLGFAIHGDDRPAFDDNDTFNWSGATPLGDTMSVEVICP